MLGVLQCAMLSLVAFAGSPREQKYLEIFTATATIQRLMKSVFATKSNNRVFYSSFWLP